MKKKIAIFSSIGGVLLIAAIILIIVLCLPKNKGYRSIKVYDVKGTVNVKRDKNTLVASKDMKLKNEDVIEVKESSSTVLKLDNDKYVMVKENSTIRLKATGKTNETKTQILVDDGGVIVEVKEKLKEKESFEIATSHSVMAIRGTWVEVSSRKDGDKVTFVNMVLVGSAELVIRPSAKASIESAKLVKTDLAANQKIEIVAQGGSITPNDMINDIRKTEVQLVSDQILKEEHGISKVELTTEDIDSIVDAINDFERKDEEKFNGVIKFKFTSNPEYNKNPNSYIEIEDAYKDLEGITYTYSKTIDGEYKEYDPNNPLELGEWYCKITAGNAYRSDPLLFEVVKQQLNLSINVGQTIHAMSVTSADVVVSIEDDEFFNSNLAKELDSNMQPVNYIICKAKHYEDDKYYWGELNYKNKEVVFDRSIFANDDERNEVTPKIEFEYHISDNYNVNAPQSKEYEFVDQLNIDNIVVYYDYISNSYYLQLERGAFTTDESVDPYYFREYLCIFFSDSITDRDDTYDGDDYQTFETNLTSYGENANVDGVYTMKIKAHVGTGDYFGPVVFEEDLVVDTNILAPKVVDHPTGFSKPYMNIGAYFYTFNTDGTINVYVDLQDGIDMYEDPNNELALGDYLVRYNVQGSKDPDKYVRGNGRFLSLEHIPFDNYIIKDVFAVDTVKDGVTYALAHEENDKYLDILSEFLTVNEASQTDYGIGNTISFDPTILDASTFEIISSTGSNTYDNEVFDTDYFYSEDNSVIIKANLLVTLSAGDFESIINDVDYTLEELVSLEEEEFKTLTDYMLDNYNIKVEGFAKGEFAFKLYFKVTGDVL